MKAEFWYFMGEFVVSFFGGLWATLLAYQIVGKKPGEDPKWDAWYGRFGHHLRWLGPNVMLFAIILLIIRFKEG